MAVSMPLIIDNRCNQNLIIALTSELRLPAIYPFRYYAENGGLSSYSVPWLLGRTRKNLVSRRSYESLGRNLLTKTVASCPGDT
jgi:hypothetical protein